jgi:predicted SAM-dependent methyltransferase
MAAKGWECCGVDQIEPARFANGNPGITYFCSGELALDHMQDYFDVITFWHSMEHMADPASTVRKAAGLLNNSGLLFVCVPNGESVEARMQIKNWLGFLPEHRFIFTEGSLRRLMERNGFEVVSVAKNSFEYGPTFFIQSMFNFLGGEKNFLYNFFKRNRLPPGSTVRRLYTVLLVSFLLPFLTAAGLLFFAVNGFLRNGSVLEVFCRKRGQ